MVKKVLVVGLVPALVEQFRSRLDLPGVEVVGVAGVDRVRAVLDEGDVDHVVLGGGMDLDTRLDMVRVVFESSARATVHLKDHRSGPEGFVPFVRALVGGLEGFVPDESPNAVLREQRSG
jgi:hypothetical protein